MRHKNVLMQNISNQIFEIPCVFTSAQADSSIKIVSKVFGPLMLERSNKKISD